MARNGGMYRASLRNLARQSHCLGLWRSWPKRTDERTGVISVDWAEVARIMGAQAGRMTGQAAAGAGLAIPSRP